MAYGKSCQAGDLVDIELVHGVLPVLLYRLYRNTERFGDFLVRFPFCNSLENLELAICERLGERPWQAVLR